MSETTETLDQVNVNGVEYVRKDSYSEGSLKIVVADRGWVFVGYVEVTEDSYVVSRAKNVCIWGTTNGLGEIAKSGPTAKTKLDDAGTVRIPKPAMILMFDTNQAAWEKAL